MAWDIPAIYAIIYPASGLLADKGALEGASRPARTSRSDSGHVLRLLDQPASTNQLVDVTGLALGTIGTHLRILLDAASSTATAQAQSSFSTGRPAASSFSTKPRPSIGQRLLLATNWLLRS